MKPTKSVGATVYLVAYPSQSADYGGEWETSEKAARLLAKGTEEAHGGESVVFEARIVRVCERDKAKRKKR